MTDQGAQSHHAGQAPHPESVVASVKNATGLKRDSLAETVNKTRHLPPARDTTSDGELFGTSPTGETSPVRHYPFGTQSPTPEHPSDSSKATGESAYQVLLKENVNVSGGLAAVMTSLGAPWSQKVADALSGQPDDRTYHVEADIMITSSTAGQGGTPTQQFASAAASPAQRQIARHTTAQKSVVLAKGAGAGEEIPAPHIPSPTPEESPEATKQERSQTASPTTVREAAFARGAASVAPQAQSTTSLMPPPAAPASMLANLKESWRADKGKQTSDPSIYSRLFPAVVTLFRMGKIEPCKAIAQFTIDLVGQQLWDNELGIWLHAPPHKEDEKNVDWLLGSAVEIIKKEDGESAGFLDGLLQSLG